MLVEAFEPHHGVLPVFIGGNELVLALLERLPVEFFLANATSFVAFANLRLRILALGQSLPNVFVGAPIGFKGAGDRLHCFPIGTASPICSIACSS